MCIVCACKHVYRYIPYILYRYIPYISYIPYYIPEGDEVSLLIDNRRWISFIVPAGGFSSSFCSALLASAEDLSPLFAIISFTDPGATFWSSSSMCFSSIKLGTYGEGDDD